MKELVIPQIISAVVLMDFFTIKLLENAKDAMGYALPALIPLVTVFSVR